MIFETRCLPRVGVAQILPWSYSTSTFLVGALKAERSKCRLQAKIYISINSQYKVEVRMHHSIGSEMWLQN